MLKISYCDTLDVLQADKHVLHCLFIFWFDTELDHIKAWVKHINVSRRMKEHDPLTVPYAGITLHDKWQKENATKTKIVQKINTVWHTSRYIIWSLFKWNPFAALLVSITSYRWSCGCVNGKPTVDNEVCNRTRALEQTETVHVCAIIIRFTSIQVWGPV